MHSPLTDKSSDEILNSNKRQCSVCHTLVGPTLVANLQVILSLLPPFLACGYVVLYRYRIKANTDNDILLFLAGPPDGLLKKGPGNKFKPHVLY